MDLPQAAVVEAGVGQPRPPLVGTAGVGRNAAGGVPLHLQARRPGKRFSQTINTFAASAPKNAHPSSEWTATRVDASWTLPVAGGLLFAVLIGVRWASARWFFDTVGVGF
jgi:hypothetical protein